MCFNLNIVAYIAGANDEYSGTDGGRQSAKLKKYILRIAEEVIMTRF
jgi:hypothetical protein